MRMVIVPDFLPSSVWFNSPPLSFYRELKGKIVVLDFWTYCCINCIHVLPELKILEKKFAREPVVFIGVHSPKFTNEKEAENVCSATKRYAIEHPIVNDPEMILWQTLGIRGWPSFAIIGPKGELLHVLSGEGRGEEIAQLIQQALERFHFFLDPTPLQKKIEKEKETFFSFPSKLTLSSEGKRLFVSDSGHHRIVNISLETGDYDLIGSGKPSFIDGPTKEACFFQPQGITFKNEKLYVTDTENHALREIDLTKKIVRTLAGNGHQGRDFRGGKKGSEQGLSSPWDLCFAGEKLFIAMAGTHQIWVFDPSEEVAKNYSGCGAELHLNGGNLFKAAWAQPSGIAYGWERLFIADSESSSIRAIHFYEGETETLAGGDPFTPQNLFAFGDKDGVGPEARLQHPLGVAWHPLLKQVFVADTYNHRLKILDPKSRKINKWVGSGQRGNRDGKGETAEFSEPSGLAISPDGKWIFVADTNNHAIRRVNIETKEVNTLVIQLNQL